MDDNWVGIGQVYDAETHPIGEVRFKLVEVRKREHVEKNIAAQYEYLLY